MPWQECNEMDEPLKFVAPLRYGEQMSAAAENNDSFR